ncbi:aldehyde ferredoxin oxidoreductase [Candidatus Moduliflexus flocculans]|uniref:Aldehyde ferredoxin oxidoreductase n=1 Tax=Candidatus Moduliflexus flocculans TaxID=1499966 RepID=A0A081BMX3_9BACT|nr:aldehyde ferredoxin oxidoreductase [Candidatus Moduliflexus flocculans]
MLYGWMGKVLRVNLTEGTVKTEKLNEEWAKEYIGNRGLGTRYFVEEVSPKVDPLSADNKLIFATGPLTGALGTSTGRYEVVTKGPLTGTIAASNSGGLFGPELKFAGIDLLIFEGVSPKPVYLYVEDGKAELRDASHVWGKMTSETTDLLVKETAPNVKVACIGPAGEKLSKIANIMCDKDRAAGRSGVGAVMGSKKLKAVVALGSGGVTPADPQKIRDVALAARKKLAAHPVTNEGLPMLGTMILVNIINQSGAYPTRNFQEAVFEGAEATSGETLRKDLLLKNKGCFSCTIACGRVTQVKSGAYAGFGEGPEYESAWSLGAECGVDNLEAVTKANFLCNEYGIDTISMGSTIGCAMELAEKGYLPKPDASGLDIAFGNADVMVKLVELTGKREGIGDKLAEGSYRMGEAYGHPELSMSVKKQEMPAYDPRGIQGMALEYATSNRGGCHVRGYMISPEILGVPQKLDPQEIKDKDTWLKIFQDLTAVVDSAGVCLFTTFGIGAEEVAAELAAVTGVDYTVESVMACGDRIYNLERLFNLKAGLSGADDTLPPRLLNDPIPSGPMKGKVARLPEMLPGYYKVRDWDETGVPTKKKLQDLGLDKVKFVE